MPYIEYSQQCWTILKVLHKTQVYYVPLGHKRDMKQNGGQYQSTGIIHLVFCWNDIHRYKVDMSLLLYIKHISEPYS
jgi:hypothetical protein